MKKIIVTILAFLYISTSIGATLHMHFCMGKLAEWGFGHNNLETCPGCGMKKCDLKNNGCCRDEHKFLKNNTDQKVAESAFPLIQLMEVALPDSFFEILSGDFPSITKEISSNDPPPRRCDVSVYIRNCVFLI